MTTALAKPRRRHRRVSPEPDLAHAERVLAAEDAELRQAPLAKPCRCPRPAGDMGERRCLWCGREVA
jgi:hypothetical protein